MKVLIINIFLLLTFVAYGQNDSTYYDDYYTEKYSLNNSASPSFDNKISTRITLGSSFSSFGSANAFTTYTKPEINYRLSPKFSLSAGVYALSTRFTDMPSLNENFQPVTANFNQNSVYFYAAGNYQVNENLTISGQVTKQVVNLNRQKYINPALYNTDFQSLSLGFTYKITDYFEIEGQISHSRGYDPLFMQTNPYSGFRSSSPFYNPFHSTNNSW